MKNKSQYWKVSHVKKKKKNVAKIYSIEKLRPDLGLRG